MSAKSGSYFLRALYHFFDNFGLPLTVLCHTIGKLVLDEKLCVTAIVVSRLSTTCHIPPGTKIVSPMKIQKHHLCYLTKCSFLPGCWIHSMGLYCWGQSSRRVFGYTTLNHVIASSLCLPPSLDLTVMSSFGVSVGKKHHLLWPDIRAFHAEVPNGSIWIPVPDLGGPITIHLYGGLLSSLQYLKRSSRK